MALPVVKTVLECADYSSTVQPYLYQLRPLPQIVFESIANPAALKQIYLDTNPLISSLAFAIAITPIFLIVSEINKNYSQVDRVWSILPTIYNAHFALYAYLSGLDTTRTAAVALASTAWSTRLTYNYYRKGGYSIGSEDYRWQIVKDFVGPTVFFIFNVIFIAFVQSILLWSIATPAYVLLLTSRLAQHSQLPSWAIGDTAAFSAMLFFIGVSFIADQQQWNYQTAKQNYRKTAKVPSDYSRDDLDLGFYTKELFAYSRHPNFAAEQSVWVTLYLWGCSASGTWYNWTGIGALCYLFLFQASTWLTELLSSQKYPEYRDYKRQVGKFIPTNFTKPSFAKSPAKITNGSSSKNPDALQARARYDLR